MFKKTFILLLLLQPLLALAQYDKFLDSVLDNKIIQLPFYKQSTAGNKSLFLKMNFGKPEIIDTTGIAALNGTEILSVDLAFTDYPASQTLKPLNKKRFTNLVQLCPYLLQQKQAQWQVVRQMNGWDKASAEKLLHGIIINYRQLPTIALHNDEIKLLTDFKNSLPKPLELAKPTAIPVNTAPPRKINYWNVIHSGELIKPRYYTDRPIKDISDKPLKPYAEETLLHVPTNVLRNNSILTGSEQQRFLHTDSLYLLVGPPPQKKVEKEITVADAKPAPPFRLYDSSLLTPLKKLHYVNPLVVVDVTLSMAPYTVQLLEWLSMPEQKNSIQYITCFNDGNDMPIERKIMGQTGGIYGTPFTTVQAASNLVEATMEKGSGGDTPENVCEALIKSIAMCGNCHDVILMADNWAPVRDIELVKQITKPVHIIICGGSTGTHADYITIALQTNGSLHFENEEVSDLQEMKNGKEVLIRGVLYKLDATGKVIVVRR